MCVKVIHKYSPSSVSRRRNREREREREREGRKTRTGEMNENLGFLPSSSRASGPGSA